MLESLARQSGILGVIFRKAQNKIQDPAKLKRLIADLIDPGYWSATGVDIKGDARAPSNTPSRPTSHACRDGSEGRGPSEGRPGETRPLLDSNHDGHLFPCTPRYAVRSCSEGRRLDLRNVKPESHVRSIETPMATDWSCVSGCSASPQTAKTLYS